MNTQEVINSIGVLLFYTCDMAVLSGKNSVITMIFQLRKEEWNTNVLSSMEEVKNPKHRMAQYSNMSAPIYQ